MPERSQYMLYASLCAILLAIFAMELPVASYAGRVAVMFASAALAGPLLALAHRSKLHVPSLGDRLQALNLIAYGGGWTLVILSLSWPNPNQGGQLGYPRADEALSLFGITLLVVGFLVRRRHADRS